MSKSTAPRILALIDRLAPPRPGESNEQRRRARLVTAAALLGTVILLSNSISDTFLGSNAQTLIVNLVLCSGFISLLVVLRRKRAVSFVANALVGVAFAHTCMLSALSGGRNIGALFALAIYPLLSVLLGGWRSGLVFTGLSTLAILLTPLVPIDFMTPIYLEGLPPSPSLVRDALNVTLAIGLFSAMYDIARSLTLRDAELARDQAAREL